MKPLNLVEQENDPQRVFVKSYDGTEMEVVIVSVLVDTVHYSPLYNFYDRKQMTSVESVRILPDNTVVGLYTKPKYSVGPNTIHIVLRNNGDIALLKEPRVSDGQVITVNLFVSNDGDASLTDVTHLPHLSSVTEYIPEKYEQSTYRATLYPKAGINFPVLKVIDKNDLFVVAMHTTKPSGIMYPHGYLKDYYNMQLKGGVEYAVVELDSNMLRAAGISVNDDVDLSFIFFDK